jgi:hypothetical protein
MESPPDVRFNKDLHIIVWRSRGILDESAVNKVLIHLLRRETMAASHSIAFPVFRSSSPFTSPSNMFFMSRFTGAFPMPAANR